MPTTYLHSGAEYSQYLINIKCLYSIRPPSPSLAMLSTEWETVSAQAGINCPAWTAEQHHPCPERRYRNILGRICCFTARNWSRRAFPTPSKPAAFLHTFCGHLTTVFGSCFPAWGQLECARAFPPCAVTLRQTGREKWDEIMDSLAKQTRFKTPGVFFRNSSEKSWSQNGIRLVKYIQKLLCTHVCACVYLNLYVFMCPGFLNQVKTVQAKLHGVFLCCHVHVNVDEKFLLLSSFLEKS